MTEIDDDLRSTMLAEGPCATVVLRAPSAVEDAGHQLDLRWRNASRSLQAAGIEHAELERLDSTVSELSHGAGATLAVLQPHDAPAHVEFLDDTIEQDLAVLDELARCGIVLESRQQSIPHLMVVADRTGADIVSIGTDAAPQLVDVAGDTLHIHRGHPGGWSQRRFQQRAENLWESNAGKVAETVETIARDVGARLISVAGDVRAVGFLIEHLPDELTAITHKVVGASPESVSAETVRLAADVVARDTVATLERFREANGRGEAADGPAATLESLSVGRVETLLVHDDPDDDRRAVFDRAGPWCATDGADDVAENDAIEPVGGRLVDVALRSALLGDSEIRFVPAHGGPTGRLGAILRW